MVASAAAISSGREPASNSAKAASAACNSARRRASVGLQIGRFQLGHRLAFVHGIALVNIALIDAAGDLEADGDLDGLDVAGDMERLVVAAGEVQGVPTAGADRHDRRRRGEDQLLGSSHCRLHVNESCRRSS